MTKSKQTQTQKGLYQSNYEHDACGVGMIVNIHGNKSHQLVDDALKALENMRHRGAEVGKDGDGAGIMIQIPHEASSSTKDAIVAQASTWPISNPIPTPTSLWRSFNKSTSKL